MFHIFDPPVSPGLPRMSVILNRVSGSCMNSAVWVSYMLFQLLVDLIAIGPSELLWRVGNPIPQNRIVIGGEWDSMAFRRVSH